MDTTKKAQIQAHARAIAALLYEETDPEQIQTLAGIEESVRSHLLEYVSPEIGFFYRNEQRYNEWTKTHGQQHPRAIEH
jgi:hypothetical protein